MPDDSVSLPRHLNLDEAPVTTPRLRVEIDPPTAATRSEASWPGLAAEVVHITASGLFKCGFSASCHLLMSWTGARWSMANPASRTLIVSTRRDIGRTLSFIPKGYVFHGTFMPLILPWGGNLYIDPAMSLADPELQLDDIEFEPRLFFDEPALWTTASKILRLGRGRRRQPPLCRNTDGGARN